MRALQRAAADETRTQRPLCVASGECCRFERFGHRLYVTGLEAAWTLREIGGAPAPHALREAVERGDCPYLRGSACSIHAARPLGCRLYFCDLRATTWQQDLSERLLQRLKRLHEDVDVPYRYGDWRTMLAHFEDPIQPS